MKSGQILAPPPRVLSQEQREYYFENGHCTWASQVPRSTGQGLLLQSFCISAIHGGQMCESGYPLLEGFVSREWSVCTNLPGVTIFSSQNRARSA